METLDGTLIYSKYQDEWKHLATADFGVMKDANDRMIINRATFHFIVNRLSDLEARLTAIECES
jgi:hypothetical protein